MFLKTVVEKIWYFNLVLIIVLGSVSYLALVRHAREAALKKADAQEKILAKAQAANISSFFESFGNSIAVLAQSPSIQTKSVNAQKVMQSFVTQWHDSGLIGEVIYVDLNGLVIENVTLNDSAEVGIDVSDRDYFSWAKEANEGEYYVGQPIVSRLGVTRDKAIVPVASPVFNNGELVGVLASAVVLSDLSDRYLEMMKVSASTRTILLDKDHNLILGEMPENYEDHIWTHQDVNLAGRSWHVDVIVPIEDVEESLKPLYIRYLAIFVMVSLAAILYVVLFERNKKTVN